MSRRHPVGLFRPLVRSVLRALFRSPSAAPGLDPLDAYAVDGLKPNLVADAINDFFYADNATKTFDEMFSYTGASLKTTVDSDGVLKWAPHNLQQYSDVLDNPVWALNNATITDVTGSVDPPPGFTNVYVLTENDALQNHDINDPLNGGVAGAGYRTVALVREKDRPWARINSNSGATNKVAVFDLTTGTVDSVTSGATAGIEAVGGGWYLIWMDWQNIPLLSLHPRIAFPLDGVTGTWQGDGVSGGYVAAIWNYRSDLGGMQNNPETGDSYVPTTTAARYLPRRADHVWDAGVEGADQLSNGDFGTGSVSGWSISGGTASVSGGVVTLTNVTSRCVITQSFPTEVGRTYRINLGSLDNGNSGPSAAVVRLTSNNSYAGTVLTSATAVDSNGFKDFVATTTTTYLWLANNTTTAGNFVLIGGVELVPLGAWVNKGLLIESEARTNLVVNSENLSGLTVLADGTGGSRSTVAGGAFGGGGDAYDLTIGTGGTYVELRSVGAATIIGEHSTAIYFKPLTSFAGSSAVLSFCTAGRSSACRVLLDGLTGSVLTIAPITGASCFVEPLSDGWYRAFFMFSDSAGAGEMRIMFREGAAGDAVRICRPMSCQGTLSPAGSYIPTTGATATRAAETLPIPAALLPYDATAMSIAMKGTMTYADLSGSPQFGFFAWGTSPDYLSMEMWTLNTRTGQVYLSNRSSVDGSYSALADNQYVPGISVSFSIAQRQTQDEANLAVSGIAATPTTHPTVVPDVAVQDLRFGLTKTLGAGFAGHISEFRMWGGVGLTDAQLEEATA